MDDQVRQEPGDGASPCTPQTAVYPGSFDPITLGHIDVAQRAANLFDSLVVGIYDGKRKPSSMFTTSDRLELAREALKPWPSISVTTFTGLTVSFAREMNANAIVRGLRAVSDFEYEFKMSHMNKHLAPDIEFVCLMTSSRHSFVSSSLIREVASLGGDVSDLVPDNVRLALTKKFAIVEGNSS